MKDLIREYLKLPSADQARFLKAILWVEGKDEAAPRAKTRRVKTRATRRHGHKRVCQGCKRKFISSREQPYCGRACATKANKPWIQAAKMRASRKS